MIKELCESGKLREALDALQLMEQKGAVVSRDSYLYLLLACVNLDEAKDVHTRITRSCFSSDSYLGNTIVNTFVKCGSIADALGCFHKLRKRTAFSWTAIISWHSNNGQGAEALRYYYRMQAEGVLPTKYIYICVLKSCGSLEDLKEGKRIHNDLIRSGRQLDVFLGTALIDMYAKCGSMVDAQRVLGSLASHDVVMWTAMIAGYVQQGEGAKALKIYSQMKAEGLQPNDRTFVSLLKAYGRIAGMEEGVVLNGQPLKQDTLQMTRLLHAEIIETGSGKDMFVCNTLIDVYAKCGSMVDAKFVFDTLPQPSVVSWTALISGYAQLEQAEKALQAYAHMQGDGMPADEATYLCVLKACSHIGALTTCWKIHRDIVASGIAFSVTVANSLIHTYGKCGCMAEAQRVFDTSPYRNTVSWTALIAGYAREGAYQQSLHYLEEMEKAGIKPDDVTFLSALLSCSHAGLVDEGLELFRLMTQDRRVTATIQHYACLVDLLGRAGHLKVAEDILLEMPMQPDLAMWVSLLGACRQYHDVEIGRRAFDCAVRVQPTQSSAYTLMKNIYVDAHMWEDAEFVEASRGKANAWKKPGQTWIEDAQKIHVFSVGGDLSPETSLLYAMLKEPW